MKKLIVALVLVCLCVCVFAFAALADTEGDWNFTNANSANGEGDGVTITRYTGSAAGVTVPPTLGGKSVTCLAEYCFEGNTAITSVTIPDSVVRIKFGCFSNCAELKSVTLPSGLTRLESDMFYGCAKLESVTIPAAVTEIEADCFYGCASLKAVSLPSGVDTIGDYAFCECAALTNVNVPVGVAEIAQGCFQDCSSLSALSLPSTVTKLGHSAFYNCSSLKALELPSGVNEIGAYCFFGCSKLESVNIPSGVTSLPLDTFYECGALKSITIPVGVNSIGDYCFFRCSALESADIPSGVTEVGLHAFDKCTALKRISIPEGVTSIGNWCFYETGLTSVTVPGSVSDIGEYAFCNCGSLKKAVISSGVKTIGIGAFNSCGNLVDATLADSVTSIGGAAFYGCVSLDKITIPESVTSIGDGAFQTNFTSFAVYSGSYGESYAIANSFAIYDTFYSVTFDTNGGSAVDKQWVASGKTAAKPADPTKAGAAFAGWYSDAALTAGFDFSAPITANIIVYAKWSNEYCSAVFESNGGSAIATQNVVKGNKAVKPENPTRDGYAFAGWFTDTALTVGFDFDTPINASIVLYAKWTADYCTVKFETNGGSAVASQDVPKGSTASRPADPVRDGYVFDGWYKDSALTAAFDFASAINADTTVYAKWNKLYTVAFESNGGTAVADQSVAGGKKAIRPNDPVRNGYAFAGWYKDAALTMEFDFAAAITADIKLYAKWNEYYCVKFETNGGSAVDEQWVESGRTAVKPADPVKSGYTFAGWYNDAAFKTTFDFTSLITGNITVYAKWNAVEPPTDGPTTAPTTAAPTTAVPTTAAPTTAPTAAPTSAAPTVAPTPMPGPTIGTSFTFGGADYEVTVPGEVSFKGVKKSKAKATVPDTVIYDGVELKVTSIADKAFIKDKKLKTITIGANVETIGSAAFKSCAKLTTVKGGAVVKEIGASAFAGCKVLKKFPVMNELETIGAAAFKGCVKLTKFMLGEKVNAVGKNAFAGCKALKTITVKTALLNTDNVGAGAFKGINKKAAFKCPKEQKKAYKKLFVKKGAPKSCKFK